MDFKDPNNQQELQKRYNQLWSKFKNLTNTLIADPQGDPVNYKRGALLFYWLQQYHGYIKGEQKFNPRYRPALLKGNVVKVNFGFNLGNEFGGLHYAIVMNDSAAGNGVVTVIPLRSLKESEDSSRLRGNDVFLGRELYNLLQGKLVGLRSNYSLQLDEARKELEEAEHWRSNNPGKILPTTTIKKLTDKVEFIKQQQALIERTSQEIKSLKLGSVAIINQIRTISRMRIEDPKDSLGILYGLRLGRDKMQLVKAELMKSYDM